MVLGVLILKHISVHVLPRKRKYLKENENILRGSNTAAISFLAHQNKVQEELLHYPGHQH